MGDAAVTERGVPHLTPTLSAPSGGEGELNRLFDLGFEMCEYRSAFEIC